MKIRIARELPGTDNAFAPIPIYLPKAHVVMEKVVVIIMYFLNKTEYPSYVNVFIN